MENKTTQWADPSALGQFGLAIVTLVAGAEKAGLLGNALFVMPWAIFLGALAQIVTGIIDFKKGKQFGGTVFCAYGFFWLAIAMTWAINLGFYNNEFFKASDIAAAGSINTALGFAYIGFLVFTLFATIGSLTTNKVLTWLFLLIDVLFIALVLYSFTHAAIWKSVAAYAELAIGFSALYSVGAMTVNAQFGKVVFPLGKAFYSPKK